MVWHTLLAKPQVDPKAQGSRAKPAPSSCIANNWVQKGRKKQQKAALKGAVFFQLTMKDSMLVNMFWHCRHESFFMTKTRREVGESWTLHLSW